MARIALDAMGGDYAPKEIVKGAVEASNEIGINIILVGIEDQLRYELSKYPHHENISIQHASEMIGMNESPAQAVKQKKDSSVNVAISMLKRGIVEGVVSAGNTGALMTASLFGLGRIKGIDRPAIATIFPSSAGDILLMDMGANVDCKPKHLVQFAKMGSIYAEQVMHVHNPKIGLLNIGEEPEKGNELTISTYPLLKKENTINFTGNVESKEILKGKVNVVVCDGFTGNLILKFSESLATMIYDLLKEEISKHPLSKAGALLLLPAFKRLQKRIDYDELGGALLLGVNGLVMKAHGRSKAKAIKNTIKVANEAIGKKVVSVLSRVGEG
ncbi:phosphate acyltransferase PlsX [Candidatus Margulisiibacteriota bacterium]